MIHWRLHIFKISLFHVLEHGSDIMLLCQDINKFDRMAVDFNSWTLPK
jgi:hypothetical protein